MECSVSCDSMFSVPHESRVLVFSNPILYSRPSSRVEGSGYPFRHDLYDPTRVGERKSYNVHVRAAALVPIGSVQLFKQKCILFTKGELHDTGLTPCAREAGYLGVLTSRLVSSDARTAEILPHDMTR